MGDRKPIKLFLLTGFLGAGKTTLLKRIIDRLAGHKIGILMNEFGKISVDGVLLQKSGIDIVEINNGSVFCSCLKGAFIDALISYSELPIDYLFVEASGMADPSSIEHILHSVVGKVKGKEYDYQGAVCVVDALHFLDQADVLLALDRQVATSNMIIVNKVDLIDEQTLTQVEQRITNSNPAAELVRASHCAVDTDFLTRRLKKTEYAVCQETCNTPGNRPVAHVLKAEGRFDKAVFEDFLQALLPWTLRMKGFFRLKEGWYQVDTVGNQSEIKPTDIVRPVSELVVISAKGLPALDEIYQNWDKRFSEKLILQ
ncbi:hypothetical protein SPACI_001480 [Sporomusa acidovorans DSM 3132]|uniref:CobW C-terminal domain-containing protein n=2 Tax=Sporomusa TaxID=2375 RepID=A0ABZ3IVZ1_SPOA4|nr:putative GTP-binding protein YjiA [Sporomusa acidovorans DSM 3132]SDF58222.1 GTPase, G3E family [Sporomusa acidovorans]